MNLTMRVLAAPFLRWLLLCPVAVFSFNGLVAQERPVYVDSSVYFEMVRVQVLSIDADGAGTLRISQHDCGGCTEDVSFTEEAILESPLGTYRGLSKLSSWTDKEVLVVVGKQDGLVRRVTVN